MRRVRVLNRSRSFGRELRVAESIRRELSEIIRRRMRDPRVSTGELTLTEVRVTRDLAFADVYVQSPEAGTEDRAVLVDVLGKAAGFLRTELAQRLPMRSTPQLRFHYDDLEESSRRLDLLIEEAARRETTVAESSSE